MKSARNGRSVAQHLRCLFPLLGVMQNDTAPLVIDDAPFFDLLQRSKAAETGKVIVQAAISYARRLSSAVYINH